MNATEFLKSWADKNAKSLPDHGHPSYAPDNVQQCLDAAFKSGISEANIDEAARGDLAAYLLKARENPNKPATDAKNSNNVSS